MRFDAVPQEVVRTHVLPCLTPREHLQLRPLNRLFAGSFFTRAFGELDREDSRLVFRLARLGKTFAKLTKLDLDECGVTDLSALGRVAATLEELDLAGNPWLDLATLPATLHRIKTLNMDDCR